MSAPGLATLLRRAGEWLVEPPDFEDEQILVPAGHPRERAAGEGLVAAPPPRFPVVGVVGLARRCGATTLARAMATVLAARAGGAAVVASPAQPEVVALGSTGSAEKLAAALPQLGRVRTAGRLCLASYDDPARIAAATRHTAPAVVELEPGSPAVDAAASVDRTLLVAAPELEPALAAAVAETMTAAAPRPVIALNRAPDHGPWLMAADALVPDSRVGARLALAGREPRGWLGRSVEQLVDLCTVT